MLPQSLKTDEIGLNFPQSHPSIIAASSLLPTLRASWLAGQAWIHTSTHLLCCCCCCSAIQSCLTLCNPMACSTPGFPGLHYLPEFTQTHVHWVDNAIQPTHPLSFPSPPAFNLSQHQGLFQWVSSLDQVAKVFKLQLQHQYFQWIFN